MKIGICIAIIIAVLIVKKFDGHEKNKFVGAVAEYYGRDYSVEDVVRHVQGNRKSGNDSGSHRRRG